MDFFLRYQTFGPRSLACSRLLGFGGNSLCRIGRMRVGNIKKTNHNTLVKSN